MSRVQLALNVVAAAVAFYTKLFGVQPAKRRPGYANFAFAEPAGRAESGRSTEAGAPLAADATPESGSCR